MEEEAFCLRGALTEETFFSINGLRHALTIIASYTPDEDPDVEARAKAALLIAAVLELFRNYPAIEKLLSPLVELHIALQDVQNGRLVSWLTPKKKPSAPPTALEIQSLRGRCAAIMDFLKLVGEQPEREAAIFVANRFSIELLMSSKRSRKAAGWRIVRS
jgi:hypothetical protein